MIGRNGECQDAARSWSDDADGLIIEWNNNPFRSSSETLNDPLRATLLQPQSYANSWGEVGDMSLVYAAGGATAALSVIGLCTLLFALMLP